MARRSLLSEDEPTEINLSPMIDCIFILLIFFIVTTVFVEEKGLPVAKPDAAAAASPEENENITFQIGADDEVSYGGKEVGLAEVAEVVRSKLDDPEMPVVIRAHAKAKQGTFVAVWDAAKRGGAHALSFATVD